MIWYAAYGSNLLEQRFLAYLRGGAVAGSAKVEFGARNADAPKANLPYMVPRRLGFGYSSARWQGGGVCFVDPNRPAEGSGTYGRAWLLTVEQFEDVWAQENGERRGPPIDVDTLRSSGSVATTGSYGRVELVGELDRLPVATITCNTAPKLNSGDISYLTIVGQGLMETWRMNPAEAATYLSRLPGNNGIVVAEELEAKLAES